MIELKSILRLYILFLLTLYAFTASRYADHLIRGGTAQDWIYVHHMPAIHDGIIDIHSIDKRDIPAFVQLNIIRVKQPWER